MEHLLRQRGTAGTRVNHCPEARTRTAKRLFVMVISAMLLPLPGWPQSQNCGVSMPQRTIAWWPLDDTAAPIRDFANAFTSNSVVAVTLQQPGKVGAAASFNGTSSYIGFGTGPALTGQGSFTVDAWVRTTDNRGVIIQQRQPGGAGVPGDGFNGEYILSVGGLETNAGFARSDNQLCWVIFGDGAFGFNFCAGFVSDGLWHHVAATREPDGTGRIYLDGQLAGSQSAPPRTLVALNVYLGADKRDCPNDAPPFCPILTYEEKFLDGQLDEVQIINRALTQSEIHAIYQAGSVGKTNLSIDIKPDGYPNSLNIASNGVAPVSVCSTPSFDPRTLDPASLQLAGATVAIKGNGSLMFSTENVASCGPDTTYPDLVVQVVTSSLQLTDSDVPAVVTAKSSTLPTRYFKGCDTVRIVP